MDNPEKLAILGTQDTGRRQTKQKTQHNMCLTPPYILIYSKRDCRFTVSMISMLIFNFN